MEKKNRKIDQKTTFQVVIDKGWQVILTHLKAESRKSIRSHVEDALSNTYGLDKSGNISRANNSKVVKK